MRKSYVTATFIAAAASAVGAGASLKGSNELTNFTLAMVQTISGFPGTPLCPSVPSIIFGFPPHAGGGSDSGEAAMIAGNQGVAPMSRMLAGSVKTDGGLRVAGACQGAGTENPDGGPGKPSTGLLPDGGYDPTAAQRANGLVVGLDAIGVFVNPVLSDGGTNATCYGNPVSDDAGCPARNSATGLVGSTGAATTVTLPSGSTYTFNSWRDVIRVLWMGKDNSGTVNCNSEVRNFLAAHYDSMFAAQTGCSNCSGITHLWRRDDASGTSEVFSEMLGFAEPSATRGSAVPISSPDGQSYNFGSDNFCNTTTVVASGGPANVPWSTTIPGENPGAESPATGIVLNDAQDHDPIRVLCKGSGGSAIAPGDNVCERATPATVAATATATVSDKQIVSISVNSGGSGYLSPPNVNIIGGGGGTGCNLTGTVRNGSVTAINGAPCGGGFTSAPTIDLTFYGGGGAVGQSTLGLLLPLVDDNVIGATQYASGSSHNCTQTVAVHAPIVPKASGIGTTGANCPNGDWGGSAAQCFVPADSSGNPNCVATSGFAISSQNSTQGSAQGAGTGGPDPKATDTRAFNLWAWVLGTDNVYHVASDNSSRPIYGAFNRIHEQNSTTALGPTCQKTDTTDQMGCLVSVDNCSVGYGMRVGAALNPPTKLAYVNGEPFNATCVQNNFAYPLATKLYLNTIAGFSIVRAGELDLAECENDGGLVSQDIGFAGFIPHGPAANGGNPFCEDFNEGAFCNLGAVADVNACADTGDAGLALGSDGGVFFTICGNGVREVEEDCDFAAAPGSVDNPCAPMPDGGQNCSTTCRCN
jgi:hypothetical protein